METERDVTEMLSAPEAAKELGITRQRVGQLVRDRLITGVMRGGTWFFTREQIEAAKARPKVGSKRSKRQA